MPSWRGASISTGMALPYITRNQNTKRVQVAIERRFSSNMKGRCECINKAIANRRQVVVFQFGVRRGAICPSP